MRQGQQGQPGGGVLGARLGGAEAEAFGAPDGGVVVGRRPVRLDEGPQDEGVAVGRAVGDPALRDGGGQTPGQYGDPVG
ncbi:hypothetical protein [Streptomyces sp. HM190]|uniref:hypothetical protein n=1 Tax=Streptomyces sp. HM190 TaxID=2695266 RepID=UPI001F188D99|nr:hypothetical protein [Streptomyces sp. HM190]